MTRVIVAAPVGRESAPNLVVRVNDVLHEPARHRLLADHVPAARAPRRVAGALTLSGPRINLYAP